jgi:D-3-phosphoglycerate dehydrogenase
MMTMLVVHAEADPDAPLPIERAALYAVGAVVRCAGTADPEQVIAVAHNCDVLLSEIMPISAPLLAALPRCRAVVCYAIGLDHVDLEAATAGGIIVAHTPGFCADEVSNHTLLFVLACARRLLRHTQGLRGGWWPDGRHLEAELLPMGALRGERLGLIGFGTIAQRVAHKAQAFGMQICAYDPFVADADFAAAHVRALDLDELLATSDYVSLHLPVTAATLHLLDAARLALMKPSAFLINTSRGRLIDEAALVAALAKGQIAGAALDVFAVEPLPPAHPLLQMEQVIATPHIAYCSDAAYRRVREMAAAAAVATLRGQWPAAIANPQVRGRSRMERQGGLA